MQSKEKVIERLNLRIETLLVREQRLLEQNMNLQLKFNQLLANKLKLAEPLPQSQSALLQVQLLTKCNRQLEQRFVDIVKHQAAQAEQVAKLSAALSEQKKERERFKNQLKNYKAGKGIDSLISEIDSLKLQLSQSEARQAILKQQIQLKTDQQWNQSKKAGDLGRQVAKLKQQLAGLKEKLEKAYQQAAGFARLNRQLLESLKIKQDQQVKLKIEKQAEIQQALRKYSSGEVLITQRSKQIQRLQMKIRQLQCIYGEARTDAERAVQQNMQLREQLQQIKQKVQRYRANTAQKQNQHKPQIEFSFTKDVQSLDQMMGQLKSARAGGVLPQMLLRVQRLVKRERKEFKKLMKANQVVMDELAKSKKQLQQKKNTLENQCQILKQKKIYAEKNLQQAAAKHQVQVERVRQQRESEGQLLRAEIVDLGSHLSKCRQKLHEFAKLSDSKLQIFKQKVNLQLKAKLSSLLPASISDSDIGRLEAALQTILAVNDTVAHKQAIISQKTERQRKIKKQLQKANQRLLAYKQNEQKRGKKQCISCHQREKTILLLRSEQARFLADKLTVQFATKELEERLKVEAESRSKRESESLILCKRVDQKDKEIAVLEGQIEEAAKKHKTELERMAQLVGKTKEKADCKQSQVTSSNQSLLSLRQERTLLRSELLAKKQLIQGLRRQTKQKSQLIQTLNHQLGGLSAEVQKMKKSVKEASRNSGSVQASKCQLERLRSENQRLADCLQQAESKLKEISSTLQRKQALLRTVQQKLCGSEDKNKQSKEAHDQIAVLKDSLKKTKLQCERKDTVIRSLKESRQQLERELRLLEEERGSSENEVKYFKAKLEEAKCKLKNREGKVLGLLNVVRKLQSKGRVAAEERSQCLSGIGGGYQQLDKMVQGLSILNVTAQQLMGMSKSPLPPDQDWSYERVLEGDVDWQQMYDSLSFYFK